MTPSDEPPRPGVTKRIRNRPVLFAFLAAAALAAVAVVLIWFQPQALLFDTVVDEEFPTAEATEPAEGADSEETTDADSDAGAGTVDDPDEPAGLTPLASGAFESRGRYDVEGDATVFQLDDGAHTLRLEDFSSTNGPDLFVYLTDADAADSDPDLDADFVNLGELTGNVGNQNYDIPDDVDLDRYDTVVIWCRRFTVGFGAADLAPTDA